MKNMPPERVEAIRQEYADMAQGYDAGSVHGGWSAPQKLVETLMRLGKLNPYMDIVDFAAGTGALTGSFRGSVEGHSLHIVAADVSPAMLDVCRAKKIADQVLEQDITQPWAIRMGSKDIVAATGVAEYLDDSELESAIAQGAKALKTGGTLAFSFLPETDGPAGGQKTHSLAFVRAACARQGIELQFAERFDAYRADNGAAIQHVMAVGQKLG